MNSSATPQLDSQLLANPVLAYRNVIYSGTSFSSVQAMMTFGISRKLAESEEVQKRFMALVERASVVDDEEENNFSRSTTGQWDMEIDSKVNRAVILTLVFPAKTNIEGWGKCTKGLCMRLAGFTKEESLAGAARMRFERALKKTLKTRERLLVARPVRFIDVSASGGDRCSSNDDANAPNSISPLSTTTTLTSTSTSSAGTLSNTTRNTLVGHQSEARIVTMPGGSTLAARSVDRKMELNRLTCSQNHRKTVQAKQQERQLDEEWLAHHTSGVKVGSVLLQSHLRKENTLKHLNGADDIAEGINSLFGFDVVTGNELKTAVHNDRVGKTPPRRGRPSQIPEDEFKAMRELVWSLSAIEQANASDRLGRKELQSLVGHMVNSRRDANGEVRMNEVSFFSRIEKANALRQNFEFVDEREALRVKWLTYAAQKQHYENYEETMVDLGLARHASEEELERNGEHIIFFPGQEENYINIDEMSFSLDGTSNSGRGGRPTATPSDVSLPETGTSAQKAGRSMTLVFGVTGAGEALPPLVIFPTDAKKIENIKLSAKMLPGFKQIDGQYGFPNVGLRHEVVIAVNPKGGMSAKLWTDYCLDHLMPLFPTAQDSPGKRVVVSADSGPGRSDEEYLAGSRAGGFYFYPGLPNGTEVGQEMDQLFGELKRLIYKNRRKLFNARREVYGESAAVRFQDVGYLLFGGEAPVGDGTFITLEDAFSLKLTPELIVGALKKCGYCPNTRNALTRSQIRHEIVLNEDGEIDDTADPFGSLLQSIEDRNHEACDFLIARGYKGASSLRRFVRRITGQQTRGRKATTTIPNTEARQKALMDVSTPGQFFSITGGGGPGNSDDVLIARARKNLEEEVVRLEKVKSDAEDFAKIAEAAMAVLNLDRKKWRNREYETVLKWKQWHMETVPQSERPYKNNRTQMVQLWDTKYKSMKPPATSKWTDKDEAMLVRKRTGEIDLYQDTALKAAFERNEAFILLKLRSIPSFRRKRIFELLLDLHDETQKEDERDVLLRLLGREQEEDVVLPQQDQEEGGVGVDVVPRSNNSEDSRGDSLVIGADEIVVTSGKATDHGTISEDSGGNSLLVIDADELVVPSVTGATDHSSSTINEDSDGNSLEKWQDETGQLQRSILSALDTTTMFTAESDDSRPPGADQEHQKQQHQDAESSDHPQSNTVDSFPPVLPHHQEPTSGTAIRTVSIPKIAARLTNDDVFALHAADLYDGELDPTFLESCDTDMREDLLGFWDIFAGGDEDQLVPVLLKSLGANPSGAKSSTDRHSKDTIAFVDWLHCPGRFRRIYFKGPVSELKQLVKDLHIPIRQEGQKLPKETVAGWRKVIKDFLSLNPGVIIPPPRP